ncbi:hypothetical protein HF882_01715 [Victivallis vadensis]|jgi:hypothetical protein|uniref:Uncharacterized protein n=1 Tax=Victivallis vadensis TaxID=172901 RepID=A0A848AMZ3_9BACT|nr:hypothetical protein [Victivallis vadensis]NMD85294.1 hypothetical protein [Victivallis vadensis]
MDREELNRYLPPEYRDFNDWCAHIPKYNSGLTVKIDAFNLPEHPESWSREKLYEIVLWELNRYPQIDDALFAELGRIAGLKRADARKAAPTLKKLLQCRNVGLTMATAILRFINPAVFQTMNRRNFHVVLGSEEEYPDPPAKLTPAFLDRVCDCYFRYLEALRELTGDGFDFEVADRMLYQVDKASGRKLS